MNVRETTGGKERQKEKRGKGYRENIVRKKVRVGVRKRKRKKEK